MDAKVLRIHCRLRLEEPLDHGIVAGKTIATVGGIQIAQALKYPGTRALLFGDFRQSLQDFFKAPDPQSAVFVADPVFPQLKAEGICLHMMFDNAFNRGIATDKEANPSWVSSELP